MRERRSSAAVAARTEGRRGPGRPPGPSRTTRLREQLVDAASRMYAAGGRRAVSFASLGERAGVTKATVFHYFPNKDAVVYAVFDALGKRLESETLGAFDPPPASHARRLERVVGTLVDFYGRDPVNARILCHGLLEAERIAPSRVAGVDAPTVFDHFVRRFTELVAAGMRAGELHGGHPLGTVMSIGGVILFELMLPATGDTAYVHRPTGSAFARRGQEVIGFVQRAMVRPAGYGLRPARPGQ